MGSLNQVTLVGRLGQDPELRYTQAGKAVTNLSVATSKQWKDASGNKQEKTEWHRVIVWEQQAEHCHNYLSKGRQVFVIGSLQTREWEDENKNRRFTTEIVANRVGFLGSKDENQTQGQSQGQTQGQNRQKQSNKQQQTKQNNQQQNNQQRYQPQSNESYTDEDIPF